MVIDSISNGFCLSVMVFKLVSVKWYSFELIVTSALDSNFSGFPLSVIAFVLYLIVVKLVHKDLVN